MAHRVKPPLRPNAGIKMNEDVELLPHRPGNDNAKHFEWVAEETEFTERSSSSTEPSPILQFVSENGKARPNGIVRNLIRSHVRRTRPSSSRPKTHDQEVEAGTDVTSVKTALSLSSRTKAQDQDAEIGAIVSFRSRKHRHENRSRREILLSHSPQTFVFDPFQGLPEVNGNMDVLIHHYDTIFRHTHMSVNPKKKWLPFAIANPILLHATLVMSALNFSLLRGKSSSPDIFYHKGETIRLINETLADPTQEVSDAMIGAVAILANLDNIAANAVSAKVHLDALEIMVKSRGGLRALGTYGLPGKLASWVDSSGSIVLETPPRFEQYSKPGEMELPQEWTPYSPMALLYKNKLIGFTAMEGLSDKTVEVYWGLRNLTEFKERIAYRSAESIEITVYSDMAERLERSVVRIIQNPTLNAGNQNLSIFRLFGIAALLHMYMFMRDLPRGLPFFHMLSSRLRKAIESVDLPKLQTQYPEMMLWVLIMGGLGGIASLDQGWFAVLVADACVTLGLRGGNEISKMLSEFLWSDLYRTPVTIGFWVGVASAQGLNKGFEVKRLADHVSVASFNARPDIVWSP